MGKENVQQKWKGGVAQPITIADLPVPRTADLIHRHKDLFSRYDDLHQDIAEAATAFVNAGMGDWVYQNRYENRSTVWESPYGKLCGGFNFERKEVEYPKESWRRAQVHELLIQTALAVIDHWHSRVANIQKAEPPHVVAARKALEAARVSPATGEYPRTYEGAKKEK